MAEDQGFAGRTQAPPAATAEEAQARIEAGLGSSRYKEYDINPYAAMVQAAVPQILWSGVYFAWQSMKGHLQGLHGFDRTETFVTSVDDTVYMTALVVFDNANGLAEWMQNGYPLTEMLGKMGIPDEDVHLQLVRDFS